MTRLLLIALLLGACAPVRAATNRAAAGSQPRTGPVRAAYFYSYMSPTHLDSLAHAGFDRAMIKWIGDTLDAGGKKSLALWTARGAANGVDVAPSWAMQSRALLARLPSPRRYTWGLGSVERDVGCPLDSAFWRAAMLDRAEAFLDAAPSLRRLVLDLEIYTGTRHHYDAGPCKCAGCRVEFADAFAAGDSVLERVEEARLGALLASLLAEFAARHPRAELGAFDLDFDSFVHRAFARALVRTGVPTADYCEKSYRRAGEPLPDVKRALARLGVRAPLIGGLWLGKWDPVTYRGAVRSVLAEADGYFVFTTYSLWAEPKKVTGAYALKGDRKDYWSAMRRANRER